MFSLAGRAADGRLLREVLRAAGGRTRPGWSGWRWPAWSPRDRRLLLPPHRLLHVLRRGGGGARRADAGGCSGACWWARPLVDGARASSTSSGSRRSPRPRRPRLSTDADAAALARRATSSSMLDEVSTAPRPRRCAAPRRSRRPTWILARAADDGARAGAGGPGSAATATSPRRWSTALGHAGRGRRCARSWRRSALLETLVDADRAAGAVRAEVAERRAADGRQGRGHPAGERGRRARRDWLVDRHRRQPRQGARQRRSSRSVQARVGLRGRGRRAVTPEDFLACWRRRLRHLGGASSTPRASPRIREAWLAGPRGSARTITARAAGPRDRPGAFETVDATGATGAATVEGREVAVPAADVYFRRRAPHAARH